MTTISFDVEDFPKQQTILDILIFHRLKNAMKDADVVKVYRGKKLIARIGKSGMKAWVAGYESYHSHTGAGYWNRPRWREFKRLDAVARHVAVWR